MYCMLKGKTYQLVIASESIKRYSNRRNFVPIPYHFERY